MRYKYLLVVFLLATVPCFSQGTETQACCNFAGSWYGGSPDVAFPYYGLTITPISNGRFSVTGQYGSEVQSAGYLHATLWTGEFSKADAHTYRGMLFSMWQWDPLSPLLPPGVDPNLPEMDFIHVKTIEFLDCNTIRLSYDFVAVYYNSTYSIMPPLAPPAPGFIQKFDPLLVEVYYRIPTTVPQAWRTADLPNAAGRNWKLPRK
ncbi:MAG: hypothetical protein U0Q18_32215 [Bryobacteraceae bacterium]